MKSLLLSFVLSFVVFCSAYAQSPVVNVSGEITANTTWTNSNVYFMQGFVYVKNNATLTIEPGTIIKGDKGTKGTLIITRGAKIIADGTPQLPIVFTSNQPAGERTYGDWGGLIICGKAPVNKPGSQGEIEGGVNNAAGDAFYGGTDANDNSGVLRYVRIEFPGIAFTDNNEINGLTCGGVGAGTTIEHVQVSYSGDDSFEFFGGNVNAKYLIAYRGWDDDFDTDFGYSGKIQFAVSLRDPEIADQSGSNGFESDNDGSGTYNAPFTQPIFSNVTVVGPVTDAANTINSNYKRGAHIRRNSRCSIYNSVIMGYPTGLLLDGAASQTAASGDTLQIRNTTFVTTDPTKTLTVETGGTYNVASWYNTASYSNQTANTIASQLLSNPQNLDFPDFRPLTGSPLLSGADFNNSRLDANFFQATTYRGAFGSADWTAGWANWDAQNAVYNTNTAVSNLSINNNSVQLSPNPSTGTTTLSYQANNNSTLNIYVTDLSGKVVKTLFSGDVQKGTQTLNIDTQDLSTGMYLVQINNSTGTTTAKLMVK